MSDHSLLYSLFTGTTHRSLTHHLPIRVRTDSRETPAFRRGRAGCQLAAPLAPLGSTLAGLLACGPGARRLGPTANRLASSPVSRQSILADTWRPPHRRRR